MPEGRKVGETTATRTFSFSALTSMMPRQVMLSASSNSKSNGSKAAPSLTAEQRKLLLQAVCQFLELNGFSKTLKKFLREAELEKDSSKNSLYNLEDMCIQYLTMRASSDGDDKKPDKQDSENTGVDNGAEPIPSEDKAKKEKKKKSKTHSEGNDVESSKQVEIVKNNDKELQDDVNLKSKDKKKKKSSKDSVTTVEDASLEDAPEKSSKKSKEKKKSKSEKQPDSSGQSLEQKKEEELNGEKEEKKSSSNAEEKQSKSEKKDKKSSKKRKREEENEENNATEQLKQSKTDGSGELKAKDEDNMVESQTPGADTRSNGFLELNGEEDKSTGLKSSKKQKTGSTEPRTLNAFRRVDPEKVVIEDERLQDNSYWAKSGADSGYGAKAQEVLGQVRGRDFRHEKTKKKRGSYRGGLIDQDSHSIKFNYSDEDE